MVCGVRLCGTGGEVAATLVPGEERGAGVDDGDLDTLCAVSTGEGFGVFKQGAA